MVITHIALAVVVAASISAGSSQVMAIELGNLQAVPSSPPSYILRLSFMTLHPAPSVLAAVTVRQPPDVISFVTRNMVELRLRALRDIELEVSHRGGQTLDRLLLKSELQVTRLRLEEAPTRPFQSARAEGRDLPLTQVVLAPTAAEVAADYTLLEHEVAGIRREMQDLVGRVLLWQGSSSTPQTPSRGYRCPHGAIAIGGIGDRCDHSADNAVRDATSDDAPGATAATGTDYLGTAAAAPTGRQGSLLTCGAAGCAVAPRASNTRTCHCFAALARVAHDKTAGTPADLDWSG